LKGRRTRRRNSRKGQPKRWQTLLLVAVAVLAIGGIFGTIGTVAVVGYYSQGLPSLDQLREGNLDQTTRIYDRNGTQITSFFVENRTIVPLSQIAQPLQDATISTEDRTFYTHQGVDYRRVIIAAVYDATHRGAAVGGSTITQQLIKNDVLCATCAAGSTSGQGELSFSRKMRELLLAEELERRYSKSQILELYLNSISYGNRAFGIEAAAHTYFGVSAARLTLPEASFLAGLPQAPSAYNPFGTPDQKAASKDRWLQVLDSMVANHKLTAAQAAAAFKTDIWTAMAAHHAGAGNGADPLTGHFVDYTVQYLKDHGYDERTILTGGLSIYTTLDLPTQQKADAAVKAGVAALKSKGANTGALLAMDPKTGEIRAMVGSADYASDAIQGQVNLTDVGRQPGSSFKPYTYAYALQTGQYTPSTLVNDHDAVIGGAHFTDWDGRTEGYIPLRTAVTQSRNLPALWTFRDVGPQNVIDFAHRLGALGNFDASSLTTTIGSSDIKMVDHLAAYSAFDNGGFRVYPHPILKIVDSGGHTLPPFAENTVGGSVMSPDLAYLMNSILHGVPGTELGMDSLPVAGKTGTTDGYTSSWMMGYTPDLAVGTFMGHINAGPTCDSGFLAYGSPGVPTSGWICPTKVLWGEDVGAVLWKPFLLSYYSGGRAWPAGWAPPSGVTGLSVCKSDGGLAGASTPPSDTYREVFLKSAPPKPCGQNVAPGVPTPKPAPSPTPTPVVTPLPTASPVPSAGPTPTPASSATPTPHK
jgi:membrane peptidoglycan carboxypeptidase